MNPFLEMPMLAQPTVELAEKQEESKIDQLAAKLNLMIKSNNPESISPVWIFDNASRLYKQLLLEIKKGNGSWDMVLERLDPAAREKWIFGKKRESFDSMVKKLNDLLVASDPETFSPFWIKQTSRPLYAGLLRELSGEKGNPDWGKMLVKLEPKWQERWSYKESKKQEPRHFTIDEISADLTALLDKEDPPHFNPFWIKKNAISLYRKCLYLFRDQGTDWDAIESNLPDKWKNRWSHQKTFEQLEPEHKYTDSSEVADAIGNDKLYVFSLEKGDSELKELMMTREEVSQERQKIIEKLVALAKEGNVSAQDTLIGLVMPLVEAWLEKNIQMSKYLLDRDKLEERIRRCVYNYKNSQNYFLNYLYSSL
ncbi:MAG: hypothetical protein WCW31_05305, partial [Patescibacteria group bacterium]